MIIKVLASGSKGNCSYLEIANKRFIIDIGITYSRLTKNLANIGLTIDDINGLFLTHTHKDHILGLAVLVKHSHFPIYIKEGMYGEIEDILPKDRIIYYQDEMTIENKINLFVIPTSHDAPDSVGFLFDFEGHNLVYITDTGYINRKYLSLLKDKEIYYMESNHDEKMLMDGSYPYHLKQRIIGDKGHLSNEAASNYLGKLIGKNTKYVILAHLSEHNNTESLAYEALKNKLTEISFDPAIIIAKQNEASEKVEV